MLKLVAQLGGYVNRPGRADPPGPQTVWLGLQRMYDLARAWQTFGPGAAQEQRGATPVAHRGREFPPRYFRGQAGVPPGRCKAAFCGAGEVRIGRPNAGATRCNAGRGSGV